MKKEFIDKDVYFIGDSITVHGFYIDYCNAFIRTRSQRCRLFNLGNGGAKSSVAVNYIEDEIKDVRAGDLGFLSFSVNDMGGWLYDGLKEETQELLEKREARLNTCVEGYRRLINILKGKGIIPVIFIPLAVNEYIKERDDVQTVTDNKEKEDYIGPSFYTKKTFANLNRGLQRLCLKLADLAACEGVRFLSVFDYFREKSAAEGDLMYGPDGVHLTKYGHSLLAKKVLEFMGFDEIPDNFDGLDLCDDAIALTNVERSCGWLPRILAEGNAARADDIAKEILNDKNFPEHYLRNAKNYSERYKDRFSMRAEIKKIVYEWFGQEPCADTNE